MSHEAIKQIDLKNRAKGLMRASMLSIGIAIPAGVAIDSDSQHKTTGHTIQADKAQQPLRRYGDQLPHVYILPSISSDGLSEFAPKVFDSRFTKTGLESRKTVIEESVGTPIEFEELSSWSSNPNKTPHLFLGDSAAEEFHIFWKKAHLAYDSDYPYNSVPAINFSDNKSGVIVLTENSFNDSKIKYSTENEGIHVPDSDDNRFLAIKVANVTISEGKFHIWAVKYNGENRQLEGRHNDPGVVIMFHSPNEVKIDNSTEFVIHEKIVNETYGVENVKTLAINRNGTIEVRNGVEPYIFEPEKAKILQSK